MRLRSPEYLWGWSRQLHSRGFQRIARVVKTFNWMIHKCLLPAEALVGTNVILEHYALGVVIHPQVVIGNNCRIYHHVTMAIEAPIGSEHLVVIGNNVTLGANAVIAAGPGKSLSIGDDAILGAGAVLTKSIPAGEIWAGNPAKRIGTVQERNERLKYRKTN